MSWPAPSVIGQENAAALRAMLRRRKPEAKLYWILERPRPRFYARAVTRVIVYRVIAVVAASLGVALCAFLGGFVGRLGYPRWPAVRSVDARMITLAIADALPGLGRLIPAFIGIGLILISIPRAHLWLFRIAMLTGVALGYYQRYLPAFPWSAGAADVTRKPSAELTKLSHFLAERAGVQFSFGWGIVVLALAAAVASILYRRAYVLTVRTMSFIPRRPKVHNRSAFTSVSITRRLAAVPLTAGLLAACLWIVQNIRASLPDARYGIVLFGQSADWATGWIIATVVIAFAICAPGPRGHRLPLILLLSAITAYSFWPEIHLIRMPAWIPAATGNSVWGLAAVYLLVTGFGIELVAGLLDWHADIPLYARRA